MRRTRFGSATSLVVSLVLIGACESQRDAESLAPATTTLQPAVVSLAQRPPLRHSARMEAAIRAMVPGVDDASGTVRRALLATPTGLAVPVLSARATQEEKRAFAEYLAAVEELSPGFTVSALREAARRNGQPGKTVIRSQRTGEAMRLP